MLTGGTFLTNKSIISQLRCCCPTRQVTMDVVKTFYAVLIHCDNGMKDSSGGCAVANNTSISEDLGQVGSPLSISVPALSPSLSLSPTLSPPPSDSIMKRIKIILADKEVTGGGMRGANIDMLLSKF